MLNYMNTYIVGAPTILILQQATIRSSGPPCSEGQRGGLGEYRPSERSTACAKQGVLGNEAKGASCTPRGRK